MSSSSLETINLKPANALSQNLFSVAKLNKKSKSADKKHSFLKLQFCLYC